MDTSSVYQPLNEAAQEIRVLTLQVPANEQEPIRCTLSNESLDAPDANFVACSYAWGDQDEQETVYVNNYPIQITSNLFKLLQAIRIREDEPFQRHRFWIDAICINQTDMIERASQVQLMKRIYREARCVIAWLGQPCQDSELAFQVLGIAAREIDAGTAFKSCSWLEKQRDVLCDAEEVSDESLAGSRGPDGTCPDEFTQGEFPFNAAWRSIFCLINRPYFERLWTFQEVVLPCTAYLLCGVDMSRLDNLIWLFLWINDCSLGIRPTFMDQQVWASLADRLYVYVIKRLSALSRIYDGRRSCHGDRRMLNLSACTCSRKSVQFDGTDELANVETIRPGPSLWDLAILSIGLRATDLCDQVYGLLGLVESPIVPDYRKTPRDVLTEFARTGLRRNFDDILWFSRWTDPKAQPAVDLALPSWVPCLNTKYESFKIPALQNFFHASSFPERDNVQWPRDWKDPWAEDEILHVQGIDYDQIAHVSVPIENQDITSLVAEYLHHQEPGALYVTGMPQFQAILRVVLQDFDIANQKPLVPGGGAIQRSLWAFLGLLLLRDSSNVQDPLQAFGLTGLVDEETRERDLKSLVLGDCDDGEFIAEGKPFEEALIASKNLWTPMLTRMMMNHGQRLFRTTRGYLGISQSDIECGDSVCILSRANSPVVLRRAGPHRLHLGPCYVQGLMYGEAIREMVEGGVEMEEFQIC